ncbi:hypothetical protein ACRE_071480 [Hapsidospora chrysogenum ATCC 11550]|uniref:RING-type domain-containing protein n=1 Tax=Hapsidospora chrysogenum (strain ATCC 11550 / CBS 779.69 / DSM 880 / IAM 14645 / JCM 23072 / IMI 49137) TaxID=857340 RepID=A0A086SYD6_HAPC1|nr:hypothetical protein ACRE_071480 [Hapsidospora chrysogenum ATCC 11550]
MEDLSIALVCLFCILFIMAPLIGAFSSHRRNSRPNAAEPAPKQLLRARRKLSTVAAYSSVSAGPARSPAPGAKGGDAAARDVEATAAQLELGECPICIGPLAPEQPPIDGNRIHRALDELTILAADRSRLSGVRRWTSNTASPKRWRRDSRRGSGSGSGEQGAEDDDADNDVLTLNICRHTFHSRCLASWFLMQRYDCPVCRVVYYRRPSLPGRVYLGPRARVMESG